MINGAKIEWDLKNKAERDRFYYFLLNHPSTVSLANMKAEASKATIAK